jgi:hypothetical protein
LAKGTIKTRIKLRLIDITGEVENRSPENRSPVLEKYVAFMSNPLSSNTQTHTIEEFCSIVAPIWDGSK